MIRALLRRLARRRRPTPGTVQDLVLTSVERRAAHRILDHRTQNRNPRR